MRVTLRPKKRKEGYGQPGVRREAQTTKGEKQRRSGKKACTKKHVIVGGRGGGLSAPLRQNNVGRRRRGGGEKMLEEGPRGKRDFEEGTSSHRGNTENTRGRRRPNSWETMPIFKLESFYSRKKRDYHGRKTMFGERFLPQKKEGVGKRKSLHVRSRRMTFCLLRDDGENPIRTPKSGGDAANIVGDGKGFRGISARTQKENQRRGLMSKGEGHLLKTGSERQETNRGIR